MEKGVSSRIQARLQDLGITATHAAVKAGLGKTAVRDIIAGKSKSPTIGTLFKLAVALECSVLYLLGVSEESGNPADLAYVDLFGAPRSPDRFAGLLLTGIFKDDRTVDAVALSGPHLDAGLPDPAQRFKFFRVGDNSMAGVGILKSDVLTVTDSDDTYLDLREGMLVVMRLSLGGRQNLQELSVRVVSMRDDTVYLETSPLTGGKAAIVLQKQLLEMATEFPNAYSTKEGDVVHIRGKVVRVTRDLR